MIPPLPVPEGGHFTRPLRVCFSVPEFLGFPNRGGIGQAYGAFAEALAEAGHQVTVLMAAEFSPDDQRLPALEEETRAIGAHLVVLPELPFRCVTVPNSSSQPLIAYRAWHWLKAQHFDIIHFTEYQTSGFFCVSEKRAGLGFQDTLLCVSLRSPSRWCREGDDMFISDFAMLESDFLEQRTAELADLVFVPSQSIAKWVIDRGWTLPASIYHQPNLTRVPDSFQFPAITPSQPVTEIVFFGRLQPRKGLFEFCEAIDRMDPALLANITITFLGSHVREPIDSRSYLTKKASGWNTVVNELDHHSREEGLAYLRRPGVLAVLPSRAETFGNAVYECLVFGIPFLAANTPGIPELIQPQDREAVLFELSAKALAEKLSAALINPPCVVPPRHTPKESKDQWVGWHNGLTVPRFDDMQHPVPAALPRVSVCLVHFNQPVLVLKAIESLEAQTYSSFEVILVDDGSTHTAVPEVLLQIEQRFAARGWRVVRQENRYIGAARNHAAREASGEFLMFMDDDNIAKPGEIASFVRAALTSKQDVVVSTMDCFEGLGDPLPEGHPGHWRQLFLGGPLSGALFQNTLGDANLFVRRAVYEEMGGFSEMTQITGEDRYFLARAELAGHRILLLPEPLYHYRLRPDSVYRSLNTAGKEKLVISVFDDVVSQPVKDSLEYAFSLHKMIKSSGRAATRLRNYRTVFDSSASDIGVEVHWGTGWFEDEMDQIWSGGEELSATLLLKAASPCFVDFRAHVAPAEPGNTLCVRLNGKPLDSRIDGQTLRVDDIPVPQGVNTLSFTPTSPPARVIAGDHRKLAHLFTRIAITPSAAHYPGRIAADILTPAESTDRTVLINELFKIGAQAVFGNGWYDDETVRRWAGRGGQTSSLVFQSPIEQKIRLKAHLGWLSDANSLSTHFHGDTTHFAPFRECLDLELTLKPDLPNTLHFETILPPGSPGPHDPRSLSFCLSNIRITLVSKTDFPKTKG